MGYSLDFGVLSCPLPDKKRREEFLELIKVSVMRTIFVSGAAVADPEIVTLGRWPPAGVVAGALTGGAQVVAGDDAFLFPISSADWPADVKHETPRKYVFCTVTADSKSRWPRGKEAYYFRSVEARPFLTPTNRERCLKNRLGEIRQQSTFWMLSHWTGPDAWPEKSRARWSDNNRSSECSATDAVWCGPYADHASYSWGPSPGQLNKKPWL